MDMAQGTRKDMVRTPNPGSRVLVQGISSVVDGGVMMSGQLQITYGMTAPELLVPSAVATTLVCECS